MSKKGKANTEQSPQEAAIEFAVETLSGDLRDSLLTHVRSMETPWSKLSQDAQQDKIDAVESMAEDVVRRAVSLIARRGFDLIPVKIADFTVKGGAIKGKFEAIVSESNVVSLSDHQAKSAVIVLTDAADFLGEREPARADPDQPDMLNDDPSGDEPDDPDGGDDDMTSIGDAMPPIPRTPEMTAAA